MDTTAPDKAPRAPADPVRAAKLRETSFFLVVIFVGIHTGVSLQIGDKMLAPYFLSLLGALGLLSVNLHRLHDSVVNAYFGLAAAFILLAVVASVQFGNPIEYLRATALLLYCVVIGLAFFVGLTELGAQRVENIFFWIALALVVGSALELYGPIAPVSNWFRAQFNAWNGHYDANTRDILAYGGIRPKFFASEPSILGTDTGLALFLWWSAKEKFRSEDIVAAITMLLASLVLIRSPTILFGPMCFVLLNIARMRERSSAHNVMAKLVFLGLLASVIAIPPIALYAFLKMRHVPHYFKTASFFEREMAPFLLTLDALRLQPLSGIGVGHTALRAGLSLQAFVGGDMLGSAVEMRLSPQEISTMIGNVFWELWFSFGLMGAPVIVYLVGRFLKKLGASIPAWMILVTAGATFLGGFGGVDTPQTWIVIFSVGAASILQKELAARPQTV